MVSLSPKEKNTLNTILKKGTHKSRTITRARVLQHTNKGYSDILISTQENISPDTVLNIRRRYSEEGLDRALYDASRTGAPHKLEKKDKATLVALACTTPPDGADHWTLDLLSETLPQHLKKHIGRSTIHRILLAHETKPWTKKNVVHSRA